MKYTYYLKFSDTAKVKHTIEAPNQQLADQQILVWCKSKIVKVEQEKDLPEGFEKIFGNFNK